MNAFQIEYRDRIWHVLIGNDTIPCTSKQDAEILAQIPVQEALAYSNALRPPDTDLVRTIIQIGDEYRLMRMPAFRKLKTWLATA